MFEIELFIRIKIDLPLNNLQGLICHKTKLNHSCLEAWYFRKNTLIFNFLKIITVSLNYIENQMLSCVFYSHEPIEAVTGRAARLSFQPRPSHQRLPTRRIFLIWHLMMSLLSFWFGLVWFYGTSTIVGYLTPDLLLYI